MFTLTVLPIFVVLAVALAAQALDIYQVNAWNLGTVRTEPWRSKVSSYARAVVASLNIFAFLWRHRRGLAFAAVVVSLLLADLHAGAAAGGGAVLAIVPPGEPTLAEVKAAIEASNRLFEEFKQTNNAKLKQLEDKGVADPLIQAKLDKLNAAIEAQSAVNEAFMAVQAKLNRLELSGLGDAKSREAAVVELKAFNLSMRSLAATAGRMAPPDLDADGYKAYKEAQDKYLRRGMNELAEVERRALSVGTDPQGGYLVTPDLSGRMVQRAFETSPMRQYASSQVISTDALEGTVDIDEATFGWVSELGTRSDSNTPNVPVPWRIPVHEAYSQPKASQKLVEDANIDVAGWLAKKTGDKIGRGFNTAFVTGNGIGKPRGFASYTTAATADATRAWGTPEHVATGSNGSFGTDPNAITKLLSLIHKLKDVHAARAAFYANRTTVGGLRATTDASSAGKYVFVQSMQAGLPDQLFGYPIRRLQDMADYTTTDALAIAFGDMEETYQIVDRLGISVLVDPYTSKPYIIYYTRARVGGDVLNFDAMKFLKFGTS